MLVYSVKNVQIKSGAGWKRRGDITTLGISREKVQRRDGYITRPSRGNMSPETSESFPVFFSNLA